MSLKRYLGHAAAFVAIAAVFGVGSHFLLAPGGDPPAQQQAEETIGGPFELVDPDGNRISHDDLHGNYTMILFGYTFCPDICPMTLQKVTWALDTLAEDAPEKAANITPVFITVDPARDTKEAVGDYVRHFHPRMIGLTGSESEIAQAAEAFNVVYWRVDSEETTDYTMAHTAFTFLMDPQGDYVARFDHDLEVEEIASELVRHVSG